MPYAARILVPTDFSPLSTLALDHAIALSPLGGYYATRAWLDERLGDPAARMADAEKGVALAPHLHRTWAQRGHARFHANDVEGAEADYTKSLAISPTDAGAPPPAPPSA